jgi:hypothetical protein
MEVFMNKLIKMAILILTTMLLSSCQESASDDELNAMCDNLIKVRGEITIPDAAKLKADIEADFAAKKKHLEEWKAREMKSWDDELKSKLAALDKEEADKKGKKAKKKGAKKSEDDEKDPKKQLQEEYAKKKSIGAAQFDKDIAALAPAKEEALSSIKDKIVKMQAEYDSAKQQCLKQAKSEGVSKKLAQCRINAQDKDAYWNRCR